MTPEELTRYAEELTDGLLSVLTVIGSRPLGPNSEELLNGLQRIAYVARHLRAEAD